MPPRLDKQLKILPQAQQATNSKLKQKRPTRLYHSIRLKQETGLGAKIMGMIDASVPSSLASQHTTNTHPQSHRYRHSNDTTVINNSNHGLLDQDGKVLVDRLIRSAVGINTESHHTATDSQMDAFLAGELNNMSLRERQKIFEEIHGVDQTVQETPDFVAQHLDALDVSISNIYPKPAYDMAEEMKYEYVHNDTFRLTFLRADMFDPIKAAKRLVTFFQCRLALFGPGLLTRNLTLNDLNRDDIACLTSGYFQILPSRDTAGRAVFVNLQGMFKRAYRLALNMVRTAHESFFFYLHRINDILPMNTF